MMRMFGISLLLLMTLLAGCRTPAHSWYHDGWRGFSYAEAETYLGNYENVLLICVTEDHVEDIDPAKPASWSLLCFSGTVVRTYKGDWKVGEKLRFTHGLDSTVKKQSNTRVGELLFLFTDMHTNAEFGVETGDMERYQPDTDRLLESLMRTDRTE